MAEGKSSMKMFEKSEIGVLTIFWSRLLQRLNFVGGTLRPKEGRLLMAVESCGFHN
jgi:hypothetical protein